MMGKDFLPGREFEDVKMRSTGGPNRPEQSNEKNIQINVAQKNYLQVSYNRSASSDKMFCTIFYKIGCFWDDFQIQ